MKSIEKVTVVSNKEVKVFQIGGSIYDDEIAAISIAGDEICCYNLDDEILVSISKSAPVVIEYATEQ